MRFSFAAAVAALAAGVVASDAVTETVTAYTTFCPEATTIVHGSSTYSISTVRNPFCDGWAMRISNRRMARVERDSRDLPRDSPHIPSDNTHPTPICTSPLD
jgi:hypothetical protein